MVARLWVGVCVPPALSLSYPVVPVMGWLMCAPNVLSLSYIEFTGTQIMVTPDLPSPARMSWENCCAVPSQLSSHMCYVELVLKGVLLHLPDTMTPVKSL